MHSFGWEVLFTTNRRGWRYLIRNIIFPPDWHQQIAQNDYLKTYWDRGVYHPNGKGVSSAAEQVLKYHRNGPAHDLELDEAKDVKSPHGIKITRGDVGRMMYSVLDMTIASFAQALHRLGNLSQLRIATLFPGTIVEPEDFNDFNT